MKNIMIKSIGALALVAACSTSHAATTCTWTGTAGDGLYTTAANWSGADVPDTSTEIATMDTLDAVTTLSGDVDTSIYVANVKEGHTFNINLNATNSLTIARAINFAKGTDTDGSVINQYSGTVNVLGANSTSLSMSGNTTASGTSEYNLYGGTLNARAIDMGLIDTSTISIFGDSAEVNVTAGLDAYSMSVFNFELGETGINTIDIGGTLAVTDGAEIVIDASNYTGEEQDIVLFSAASITGDDFTVSGLESGWSITQDDSSIILHAIPEPATLGLLGLGALGMVAFRRRFAK